jgi:hypothetical protein
LLELLDLRQAPSRGGLSEDEISGRVFDLLFRLGRWSDAALAAQGVRAAPGDPQWELRVAFAVLSRKLPGARPRPRAFATELALQPGPVPRLSVGLAGKERALVVDTGASFTTFGEELAREVGVEGRIPAGTALDGAGQPFPVSAAVLPQFTLGDTELGRMPVLVVADERLGLRDLSGGAEASAPGVLGQDVLTRFRLTIDGTRRSVVFEPLRGLSDQESVACVWHEGRILVPAIAEGRKLWLVLDTGASSSSLTAMGVLALPQGDRRADEGYAKRFGPGGTSIAVRVVRDLALTIGNVRFSAPELPVLERGPKGVFPVHGVLGADVLLQCRITLDRGRLKVTK